MKNEYDAMRPPALAAFCGLFCGACSVYIGSTEDPERLKKLATRLGTTPDDLRCLGCRSGEVGAQCRDCAFTACAKGRGLAFCSECADYPCARLEAFQRERPHRRELWNDLGRIREKGAAAWIREKLEEYACPVCGTVNSAYDLACRKCGASPSCDFVRKHREAIEGYFSNMKKGAAR